MAHTIEEMRRAKTAVSIEVSRILAEFEKEYNVSICDVGYMSDRVYNERYTEPVQVVSNFQIEVKL